MLSLFRVTSGFKGDVCLVLKNSPVPLSSHIERKLGKSIIGKASLKEIELAKWDLNSVTKPASASAPVQWGKKPDLDENIS